jgi:hypothetical protein
VRFFARQNAETWQSRGSRLSALRQLELPWQQRVAMTGDPITERGSMRTSVEYDWRRADRSDPTVLITVTIGIVIAAALASLV